MPVALAIAMLTAVGLSLAGLGVLGATLSAWQLFSWTVFGAAPVISEVWRHSGLAGDALVGFFAHLPGLLVGAVAFHVVVASLGIGLVLRRAWARIGTIGFSFLWAAGAALGWLLARRALDDLAGGFPDRAAFAGAAASLAAEFALVNIGLAAALVLFLIQPAVRAQFSTGS